MHAGSGALEIGEMRENAARAGQTDGTQNRSFHGAAPFLMLVLGENEKCRAIAPCVLLVRESADPGMCTWADQQYDG